MSRRILGLTACLWLACAAFAAGRQASAPSRASNRPTPPAATADSAPYRATLDQYCVTCHSTRLKIGGLVLEGTDLGHLSGDAELWEKVVRKVRAGVMPPQGARQPDAATAHTLIAWLESGLDAAAATQPDPGRPLLHRLNRAEYKNAIRDLLRLDVDVTTMLPPDDSAYGFDNVSDVLGVSPSLQERYLTAASRISTLAVGDRGMRAGSDTYRVAQDLSQNQHIEGLPLGTVGGLSVRHTFPLDAEYEFRTQLYRTNLNIVRGLQYPNDFEIAIDGKPVHLVTIGGMSDLAAMYDKPTDTGDAVELRMRVRVPVAAGPHDVSATFVENLSVKDTWRLQPFLRSSADNFDWAGRPHIQTFTITGPFNPTGVGTTPSRSEIFTCRPSSPRDERASASAKATARSRRSSPDIRASEDGCADKILGRLARRAYRQPITKVELDPILAFYDQARTHGSFDAGIQRGIERILASPRFVFRVEQDPADAKPGVPYRLADLDLASRLSFFLWSSIPDEELLRLATQRKLRDPVVLERQVKRMLADPKSSALVSNFAGQWLHLRNVRSVQPNSDEFPDFDDNLRQAFRRETELLFESIVREDRDVLDLLRADYTFVNERLARHYGIPDIYGSRFRRVPVPSDARRGLLGHGSVLAVTSHAERTSPVLRGKWVLENVIGLPVPPPPGDVPQLKGSEEGQKPKTLREQMAEHRTSATCATCHKVMDPVGLALENFDAVGAWRTHDAGSRIDATGQLADGKAVDGVVTLREAILARPDVFVETMTEKLMTYALGRGVDAHDMPAIRAVLRKAATEDWRFSSLVLGIVKSVPFQMRVTPADSNTTH